MPVYWHRKTRFCRGDVDVPCCASLRRFLCSDADYDAVVASLVWSILDWIWKYAKMASVLCIVLATV